MIKKILSNIKKNNIDLILIILIIIFIYIIIINILYLLNNSNREGMDNIMQGFKDIEKSFTGLPKKIDQLGNEMDAGFDKFEEKMNGLVKKEIEKFGKNLIKGLKKGFVKPLEKFFNKIGEQFKKFGEMMSDVFNLIGNLPSCIPMYMLDGILQNTKSTLKKYLPGFIISILRPIYYYLLIPLLDAMFNYTTKINKCTMGNRNVKNRLTELQNDTSTNMTNVSLNVDEKEVLNGDE